MKKILAVAAAFALAPLAACGDSPSEEAAEEQLNSAGEAMEEQADMAEEAGNEAAADALEVQADEMAESADEVDGGDDLTDDLVTDDAEGEGAM